MSGISSYLKKEIRFYWEFDYIQFMANHKYQFLQKGGGSDCGQAAD